MKWGPGNSLSHQRGLMSSVFLSVVLAGTAFHAAAQNLTPETDPSDAPPPVQSDARGGDEWDRMQAMHARFSEGGAFGGEDYKNALIADAQRQAAKYAAQLGPNPSSAFPQWRSLGPTGAKYETNGVTLEVSDSGRTRRVLQDLNDPDTVYVLSAGGGLWKTTTFTHTNPKWAPLTDTLFTTSGGNVAFGRDTRTIYLGIGDPFGINPFGPPIISGVMVKSTDGGATWSSFQTLVGSNNVRDVAVDNSTSTDIVLVTADQGLYRSTDAGQTYTLVLAPPAGGFLGGFWSLVRTSAGWLVTSDTGTVFRSTNRGATWTQVAAFAGSGRITLGVGAPGDRVVYAFAGDAFGFQTFDLLRSADGGLSWTPLGVNAGRKPTNPNSDQPDLNLMGFQAFYNQMVLVDPADSTRRTVYLGGQLSTAKSTDGGATWTLISNWLPGTGPSTAGLPYVHADCHTATIVSLRNQTGIVFGTDGGLSVSTDGGATFDSSKNDGMVTMLAQTVAGSAKNPQNLISGAQDLGTRARLGSSSVFNQVLGGDGEGVGWSQANNAFTLASAEYGAIFSSNGLLPNTNGHWQFVGPGLGFRRDGFQFYTAIGTPSAVTDPTGGQFLTTTQKTVWYTWDGGGDWGICARARPGARLPAWFTIRDTQYEIALEAADPNFNRVAVGGYGGNIAFTLDGCPTWTVVNLINAVPGFQGYISSPAWTPQGALYVASESPLIGSVRVVKSFDNGLTWARADFGLPDQPVYHIILDPRDPAGKTFYAGTGIGVFRTTDGGASWSMFGAGLPAVTSMGLWIAPDGSVLRVATYGRGIWEIKP